MLLHGDFSLWLHYLCTVFVLGYILCLLYTYYFK